MCHLFHWEISNIRKCGLSVSSSIECIRSHREGTLPTCRPVGLFPACRDYRVLPFWQSNDVSGVFPMHHGGDYRRSDRVDRLTFLEGFPLLQTASR